MAPARALLEVTTDLVATLERAIESAAPFAASRLAALPNGDLLDAIEQLGRVLRLADALGARLTHELGERCDEGNGDPLFVALGDRAPADTVARLAGIGFGDARDWDAVGEAIAPRTTLQGETLPPVHAALSEALDNGEVSIAAARRILATVDRAPIAFDERSELERVLVDAAAGLTSRGLERLCRVVEDRCDPDGAEPREEELRVKSGVRVVRCADGLVKWIITMHPEAAGLMTAAVDARTAPRRASAFSPADAASPAGAASRAGAASPPGAEVEHDARIDDGRTLAQRRLDALESIARESLARDGGEVAGTPVAMLVTIPLEGLLSGIGSARIAGVDEPISAATARRLAADAEIIPAVLGSRSEVLDIGRAARLFTPAQRRALALRDGGCIWPGCGAPPGWCEVAHLVAWVLGGPTDLDNAALMCPFHHRRFDRDGWSLQRRDGERYLLPPPWVDPRRRPVRVARHMPTPA